MTTFAPALNALHLAQAIQNDVDAILTPEADAPKEAFHIDTDDKADWYLRQIAAHDAELALLDSQYQAAINRVASDREGLQFLYQSQLEAYVQQRIAEDKRGRKSLILPHGTCAWRTVPASVKIGDMAVALEHAKNVGMGCVKTVEQLDLKAYRETAEALLEKNAEMLPGIEVTPARESFSIKFGR